MDLILEKGSEELFPEEIYALLSNSGIWIEEKENYNIIKSYPKNIDTYLECLKKLNIKIIKIDIQKEEELDYADLTKKYFRPIKVDDITILAPWNKQNTKGNKIIIEPGMAFGTGRHESTKIMLKLMKMINLASRNVLDLGCGSGILSLYAALLDAKKVIALDNDMDTVLSAKKNIILNNTDKISLLCTDLINVSGKYEVVLANLDIRTFTKLSEKIKGLVDNEGYIIISGILNKEKKRLVSLLPTFDLIQIEKKNSWCGFIFKKI